MACPADGAPCTLDAGGTACCGCSDEERRQSLIERLRLRVAQDDAKVEAHVILKRAQRGIVRRRLAVFAVGMYDGDTSDLMAVLKRLFAGACYDVSTIDVLPVPEAGE